MKAITSTFLPNHNHSELSLKKVKNHKSDYCFSLITGASKGLGKEYALHLAELGHNLILTSLPNENLSELCEIIKNLNTKIKVYYFEVDLSNAEEIKEFTSIINQAFNINVLINNAGIGGTKKIDKVPTDYLLNIIDVNIKAGVILTHQLLPNLRKQHKSYILNVSSVAAFSPVGYKTVYPASKAFIHWFSLGLAEELKNSNISVSVITPGSMKTNPEVTSRINSQNFIGKSIVLDPKMVARKSIQKMLHKESLILLNPISYFITMLLPLRFKIRILTKLIKKELQE
ncbi:SDR family NAD(P)-dependent oxidoreductase [Tenacibaculum aestuarii]|uniref:SDR family NAD(P)-dependent oxidoreductase n=1 Tax=Tenacibaculum aestuarii TaxID=362781 RepID=UPI00389659E7